VFRIRIHLIRFRIQRFRLNTDPDPIRIQGFDDPKLIEIYNWKKKKFFGSKTTIYLSLDFRKGRPSYRRSLQPSKENIQHLIKNMKFLNFFLLLGKFCPPVSGSGCGSTYLHESGSNPDPDPKHWHRRYCADMPLLCIICETYDLWAFLNPACFFALLILCFPFLRTFRLGFSG
jgi:hypothetical protein